MRAAARQAICGCAPFVSEATRLVAIVLLTVAAGRL